MSQRLAWGAYPDTVLHFPQADLRVDLRRPVPPDARQSLRWLGLPGPFAVVTACNPRGTRLEKSDNQSLAAALAAVVRLHYAEAVPANGCAPEGGHVEPGWAISAPLPEARRLAADFLQNAFFWFDGTSFWIEPVLGTGPAVSLPLPDPAG